MNYKKNSLVHATFLLFFLFLADARAGLIEKNGNRKVYSFDDSVIEKIYQLTGFSGPKPRKLQDYLKESKRILLVSDSDKSQGGKPIASFLHEYINQDATIIQTDIAYTSPYQSQSFVTDKNIFGVRFDNTKEWTSDWKSAFDVILGKKILCICVSSKSTCGGLSTHSKADSYTFLRNIAQSLNSEHGYAFIQGGHAANGFFENIENSSHLEVNLQDTYDQVIEELKPLFVQFDISMIYIKMSEAQILEKKFNLDAIKSYIQPDGSAHLFFGIEMKPHHSGTE